MNKQDLTINHSLDEMLDALEPVSVSTTIEELEGYFICSRDFWDSLSPEKQRELIEEYPNLREEFDPV